MSGIKIIKYEINTFSCQKSQFISGKAMCIVTARGFLIEVANES